ncbi:hypothetical protein Kpol_2002p76 [Vanderwaltozyma polyspora DSM 70294]|uniref:Cell wall mannoprotein PIR1-like C-terminal domain-containing protein n=1 Tax=Vanderwaltozyma polyspora (strain ATCC 22028 / DSM 70294 / BCRC 21397 / CBS 2163 / NBRC 10782 / NRRL Y-8283 / UCD 57-17) TaxID=436907 RepID=A7TFJ1_VANPO|nr:uncharacterized protein Kpol_2002p76 [Vanderwaltozyma polyspora DSM 70294]EDO19005.1 hypothetical protein Kpol_2002p76 [Vanderwaltozyma polyspora DSM 70294]
MKMQYKKSIISATLASTALSAYVPHEPWDTLIPTATYKGGISDYPSTFGIAVVPIVAAATSQPVVGERAFKREINEENIKDFVGGNFAKPAEDRKLVVPVSQIPDGQIQATTLTSTIIIRKTIVPVSQIHDGQIQATATTPQPKKTVVPVTQIHDGQIQATNIPTVQFNNENRVGMEAQEQELEEQDVDDQSVEEEDIAEQDVGEESMFEEYEPFEKRSDIDIEDITAADACYSEGILAMTLKGGMLTDSKGRIGSIVANRQFQFDGPPPQAGTIYAAGWNLTPSGNLAIGDNDVFYQCLSGNFYNLYDQSIGGQCSPVYLQSVNLVNC